MDTKPTSFVMQGNINNKQTVKKIIFMLMSLLVASVIAGAQTTTTSDEKSIILQTMEVSPGTMIHEGVTKNGNPKYWIVLSSGSQSVNISVSPTNAVKFRSGQIRLEIVKRQNKSTGKISYGTRQIGGRITNSTPDIDLSQATTKPKSIE